MCTHLAMSLSLHHPFLVPMKKGQKRKQMMTHVKLNGSQRTVLNITLFPAQKTFSLNYRNHTATEPQPFKESL